MGTSWLDNTYNVLNTADQFAAGFGDAVSFGATTKIRELRYGNLATRNHEGGWFTGGQITGAVASTLAGFGTPDKIWKGLTWTQRGLQAYNVIGTGVGAYQGTRNLLDGCGSALDLLNFAPAIGYFGGRAWRGIKGLDNIPPLGGRGPIPIDPNDRMFSFGSHRGESSRRPFHPNNIGLPISPRQLLSDKVKITETGIDKVKHHLDRFDFDPQNQAQIQRFRDIASGKIEATQVDLNTYTHELREFLRYKKLGYENGVPDGNEAHTLWNNTHTATLEDYGLTDNDLYHPSTRIE
jgi:hypothetical protein